MKLRNLKGQTRRIFFNYLKKGYVAEQLEKRKGDCRQCGQCCALVFRCPFLNSESKCIIYIREDPDTVQPFPSIKMICRISRENAGTVLIDIVARASGA